MNEHIFIDWGTSSFRAYVISESGELHDAMHAPRGILSVEAGQFSSVLEMLLRDWNSAYLSLPILLGGMAGSARGWHQVDYVPCPASAPLLAAQLFRFGLSWGPIAAIVPGVCIDTHYGFDVMRGEEIQVVGLARKLRLNDADIMTPGTHNKHIRFRNGKIENFSTYITGEMYNVVLNNMLIGSALPKTASEHPGAAFRQGVEMGLEGRVLTQTLFQGWTRRLKKTLPDDAVPDFLSGVLIGSELSHFTEESCFLIGESKLTDRYKAALEQLGRHATLVDASECFIEGMKAIINEDEL